MGRVYNALMRAERYKETERPIGRPAPNEASKVQPESKAQPAAADAFLDFDINRHVDGFISPNFQQPFEAIDAEPVTSDSFVLDQAVAELLATMPEPAQSTRLRVAPAPAPPQVFEEPRQSTNVATLSVDPHLAAIAGSDVLASERYRTLAVRLLNLSTRRKLKTLLVTSAHAGEGKTTVAANLAWIMAKPGERRVLLIDADLRCPSIARMLGVKPDRGWLDVVEDRASFKDTAVRLEPNGLYVLAASASKGDAGEAEEYNSDGATLAHALTSSRVEKLLETLEQQFDFIIIDAPPILQFADAQRLASIVDGTAMVVRATHTHHTAVTDALKLVPKERRVGVVLNQAQTGEEVAYNKKKKGGVRSLLKKAR